MASLSEEVVFLERLYDYVVRGYRPFDTEQAIKSMLRSMIRIGKEVEKLKK